MSAKMTSVGVQCNTEEENIKVLSGSGPTEDEFEGTFSNGDDKDNMINIFLRTNADGMSVPHMFQENGQVVSCSTNYARDTTQTMTIPNSNKTVIEEQNKEETARNLDSFNHVMGSKTGKQKPVAVVIPVPRRPVISDPEETFLKQGYSSLSNNDEMIDEGYPHQVCEVLHREPVVIPVPRIPVISDPEETFIQQGYSLNDNDEVMEERYPQQVCDFLPLEPVGSACICKTSHKVSDHIEHIEEELHIPENVTEPWVAENTCQLLQVSCKHYSERKIIDENEGNLDDENEYFTFEREYTDPKYSVHTLLSEYNAPVVTQERESSQKESSQNDFVAVTVKVKNESSIPSTIKGNLLSHWYFAPFMKLCVAPLRGLILSESLQSESFRRETFQNFENHDIVGRLASNGYFYIERENEIICHLCGGRWQHGDIPERTHHPGCQYQDERSRGSSNVSPATSLDIDTIDQFRGQTFGHSLRENATPERSERDENIPHVQGVRERARSRHDNLSNWDEGCNNPDCRFFDDSDECGENSSVPIFTNLEGATDRPQEERRLFSAISHYNQMREDQLRMLIDYFLRQRDCRGPRGGRPITVLPYDRGRRRRSHITALSPRLPVQESVPPTDAADNHTPYCCTFPYDHRVLDLRNDGNAHVSQRRTEFERGLEDNVSEGIERNNCNLQDFQHLNYLTTVGRKISPTRETDQTRNKSEPVTSSTRVLCTEQQGEVDPGFTSRPTPLMPMSIHHKCAYCEVQPVCIRYEPCQHMIAFRMCARRQAKCKVCGKDIKKQTSINTT